ncbi:MAG TPA: ABC transporter substrate-binding protein, partial [Polyangia bacterium]
MPAGARNLLVTCVLATAMAMAVGCRAGGGARPGGALDRIRARGELTWGADEQGGEPYVFEDAGRGGALVGFEVDLADSLARALGVRARFVQNDWTTLIPSLERGTYDIAMNGIEVTPALAARVAFSRPYYRFSERLVARRGDGRVRDLASIVGLRVGTLAGSLSWKLARDAGADAVPYEGVDEPFVDLAHGRIDAVLLDDIIVARYAPRHPTLVAVADVADGSYAIAMRPQDDDLRQAIDRALGAEIASGAW